MECECVNGTDSLTEESDVILDSVERCARVVEHLDERLVRAAGAEGRPVVHGERVQTARRVAMRRTVITMNGGVD